MAETVREKILQNVQLTLENISISNGYRSDVKSVQRWLQRGNLLMSVPAIIITGSVDHWQSETYPLVTCDWMVLVECWICQDEDDSTATDKILNDLLADIFQALEEDNTRGGNAEDTNIGDIYPFETVEGQPYAGLKIEVNVSYTFKRSDPESPR